MLRRASARAGAQLPRAAATAASSSASNRASAGNWCRDGAGLLLGASTVGFDTGLGDLALQGALTGVVVGPVQALALAARAAWTVAAPALWAAGWTVTTLAGVDVDVDVDAQYTVFGATGAITYSALAGLLLVLIVPLPPRPRPGR